jgi:hypothetical protein
VSGASNELGFTGFGPMDLEKRPFPTLEKGRKTCFSELAPAAPHKTRVAGVRSIAAMRARDSSLELRESEQWGASYATFNVCTFRVFEIPARATPAGSKETCNHARRLIDACRARLTSSTFPGLARWISRNGRFRLSQKCEKRVFRTWLPRRRTRPGLRVCDR